jgi:hypothetical protein
VNAGVDTGYVEEYRKFNAHGKQMRKKFCRKERSAAEPQPKKTLTAKLVPSECEGTATTQKTQKRVLSFRARSAKLTVNSERNLS